MSALPHTAIAFFSCIVLGTCAEVPLDANETSYGDQLMKYWEAYKNTMVIEPCQKWVTDNAFSEGSRLTKLTRNETIAQAKSDICNKNALAGALTGATPIPFVDIAAGLLASFSLQARGTCIVAKLRGYDIKDEQTQMMMLLALGGEGCAELTRKTAQYLARAGGVQAGKKALQKVPNQLFKEVNKKMWPLLGRHMITKGPQGLLSLGKFVPVVGSIVGSVVGSAFDWFFCHQGIDFADRHVFHMLYKGEEELRAYLTSADFEEEIHMLIDVSRFDISSICDLDKDDFKELGISLGRGKKLLKAIRHEQGPCFVNEEQEL